MTKKRRKRHSPEQIVKKLRDAEAMLNAGKELGAILQSLENFSKEVIRDHGNDGRYRLCLPSCKASG